MFTLRGSKLYVVHGFIWLQMKPKSWFSSSAFTTSHSSGGPRLEQTLLCTFGYKMDTSVVVPEDGLCDFTLYDSVFKNYTYNLETPYEDSLQHFLSFASQHVKTQYGVAFSFIPEE